MTFRLSSFVLAAILAFPASSPAMQVTQQADTSAPSSATDTSATSSATDSAQRGYLPNIPTPGGQTATMQLPQAAGRTNADSTRADSGAADTLSPRAGPDTSAADSAAPPRPQEGKAEGARESRSIDLTNPRNFRARSLGNSVLLTWEPVRGASYYWLEGTGVPGEKVTDTTFTVRNLQPGTRSYSLVAYHGDVADTSAPSRATVGIWEAPKTTDDSDVTVAVKVTPDSIAPGKCARFRAEVRDGQGQPLDVLQDGTPAHAGAFKYSLRPSNPNLRWLGDNPTSLMVCATANAKPAAAVLTASLPTQRKPLTGSSKLRITRSPR